MLLYVQSSSFPYKSFVVVVKPEDTIARIRAQLLLILHRYNRDDHQFRLRFKGQYLRDAYSIDDYRIGDNSVLKMVPMSKEPDSLADLRSVSSLNSSEDQGPGQSPQVKAALQMELKTYKLREELVKDFKALMYLMLVLSPLAGFTMYWYGVFWCFIIALIGAVGCPSYTQFAGYVGVNAIHKTQFCIAFGVLSLSVIAVDIFLSVRDITTIINTGCINSATGCTSQLIYSAVYYILHAVLLLIASALAWVLLHNFKIEVGDIIEKYLVQSRDIDKVMQTAKNGKLKEKRIAAFELATLAASGDENKHRIVEEGGLGILISMLLSSDGLIQEHSVECTAELLTIPEIQDRFIEEGGLRSLTAVLRSKNERLVYEAATAISCIVSETDDNKVEVISNHGLEDLCFVAHHGSIACKRIVAGVFLELAFSTEVRVNMTSMNTPAQALINMCRSPDPETQRYSLQALELLAIESADMICAQEELLPVLLNIPRETPDEKLYLIAAKLLLYYAEEENTCELLAALPNLYSSFSLYAQSADPMVQKVIAKIIFCMIDTESLYGRVKDLKLDTILQKMKDESMDRETWDMADQALQLLEGGNPALLSLPHLTTMEKIEKLTPKGSQVSLDPKPGTSNSSL